ncbi:hypothetical protein MW887_008050 [Aspergillus wentii]|nr:hypothetical protein MW887_008050 [Aspergillus wentii]
MSCTTEALVVDSAGADPQLKTVSLGPLQDKEVLVEIHATGHEGAGVVLNVGQNVSDVQVGDKVLISYSFCGNCPQCTSEHPAYCQNMVQMNFGGKRLDGTRTISLPNDPTRDVFANFFGQSSLSRIALVNQSSLVPVPASTPLELFAPLGCGLQTGAGAILNTLKVKPGSSVAVFGAGCVGLSAIMAAKVRKAEIIVAVDLQPARLELAKELGATHTFLGTDPNLAERIRELREPGMDFALDCSGAPAVIETMIDCLGIRGRGASVGAPAPGRKVGVDVFAHLTMGKEYVGCHQGDSTPREMIPFLIQQNEKGMFPLEKMVEYYDVRNYPQAFEDMKKGRVIKPVLRWF